MKWLTLDYIREHSRLDYNEAEDAILTLYGNSAEATVLSCLNRTYDDLVDTYGEVPAPLFHAGLMLVDLAYQQRSPASPANLYLVPYTFDALIKPYMTL